MAWRPTECLLEGELDNTTPGRVSGWMRFAGMTEKVIFDLQGNFHRDIRGAKIHLTGDGQVGDPEASRYMASFSCRQIGEVGDITAGLPPADFVAGSCYVEWYSEDNGRVVIELAAEAGIELKEIEMSRYDLYTADEVFLTGTAAEVVPVSEYDKRIIGSGEPGVITRKLITAFRNLVQTTGTPIY